MFLRPLSLRVWLARPISGHSRCTDKTVSQTRIAHRDWLLRLISNSPWTCIDPSASDQENYQRDNHSSSHKKPRDLVAERQ